MPRLPLRVPWAALVLLLLAACKSPAPAPAAPLPTATRTLLPAPSPLPATAPASALPPAPTPVVSPSAAAAADTRLVIGVQAPLSGAQASLGAGIQNAAGLSVAQIARPLIDQGFSLDLRGLDDQDSPEQAAKNAAALADDPNVLCVVGHLASAATRAALPAYQRASLATVIPASAGVGLTGGRSDNLLRLVGRDDVQATVAVRFARERLKAQRAYIVEEQSDYGEVLASAFRTRAKADGLMIAGSALLGKESPLEAIRAANPDLIYLAARYPSAGPLLGQIRGAGIAAAVIGADGIDSPELLRLAGLPVQDLYYTALTEPAARLPYAAQFVADYEARYASSPPPFAAQSYDAASICIEAMARAAEAAGQRPTRVQVRDALRALGAYEGIAGSYRFTPSGELAEAPYTIVQVSPAGWSANTVVATVMAPPP